MEYLILSKSLSKSLPYIITLPDVLLIIPVNKLIVVVLPAPLCPNRQNIYYSYNLSVILLTTMLSPNYLFKLSIIIVGLPYSSLPVSWYYAELISTFIS